MASEIPEIVYAFDPQLKFMEVGILLTYFAVSCSSLSEDSAEFRYVPLYIADQVEFRCSAAQTLFVIYIRDSIALRFDPFIKRMYENGLKIALNSTCSKGFK